MVLILAQYNIDFSSVTKWVISLCDTTIHFPPKDCQHDIKLDFSHQDKIVAQYTKLEDLQPLTVAVGVQPKKETLLTTALW